MNENLFIYFPGGNISAKDANDLGAHFGLKKIVQDVKTFDGDSPQEGALLTGNRVPAGYDGRTMHYYEAMWLKEQGKR